MLSPTPCSCGEDPLEVGKASGIANMMQRFGAGLRRRDRKLFSAYGHLGSASAVTDGFRPAIGVSALLSLVGALTALALKPEAQRRPEIERAAAANIAA